MTERPSRPGPAAPTRVPISPRANAAPQATATKAGLAAASAMALALAVVGLKPDEGRRNVDYLDLARIPTACYGHTGADVRVGQRRTDAQCEAMLSSDARAKQETIAACVPALRTRPYQWAAFTRISFNAGSAAICRSTAARLANAGRWREACNAFLSWNKARVHGQLVVVRGLADRRQRERAQCLTGIST